MATATETTVNTNPTYLQLISQDEKAVKIEGLHIKAQEASLEVSRDIMNLKSGIAKKQSALAAVQRQIPYSVGTEYTLTQEIAELQTKLDFAVQIKETRFSDATI